MCVWGGWRRTWRKIPHVEFWKISWSQLGTRCRSESQRQTEGFGPSVTHGWATPAKMRKKCCYGHEKNLGQYVAVCPRLQLTSHTQPTSTLSRIKCERLYFYKEVCSSFIEVVLIVDYVSAYIFVYVYVQLYVIIQYDQGLNPCLLDHWQTLYSLGQYGNKSESMKKIEKLPSLFKQHFSPS